MTTGQWKTTRKTKKQFLVTTNSKVLIKKCFVQKSPFLSGQNAKIRQIWMSTNKKAVLWNLDWFVRANMKKGNFLDKHLFVRRKNKRDSAFGSLLTSVQPASINPSKTSLRQFYSLHTCVGQLNTSCNTFLFIIDQYYNVQVKIVYKIIL